VQQRARDNVAIGAEPLNDHIRPPRRFAPGRTCAEPDCATRLSVYNEADYCSLHKMSDPPPRRTRHFDP